MAPKRRSKGQSSAIPFSARSRGAVVAIILLLAGCRATPPAAEQAIYDLAKRFAVTGGGETTSLDLGDRRARPRLVRGWSEPEQLPTGEAVVTAIERFATVRVDVANPDRRTLVVRARRWGPPATRPARIAVLLNNRRIGVLGIGPELGDHRLALPADALHPGRNEIKISGPPRRRSAASGVAYQSLRIEGPVDPGQPRLEGDTIVLPAPATLRWVLRVPPGAHLAVATDVNDAPLTAAVGLEDGRTLGLPLVTHGGTITGDLSAWPEQMVRLSITYTGNRIVRLRAPRIVGPANDAGLPASLPVRPRANVLLYVIDTLRADHLGCYGYAHPTSPTIDGLARDGVLFEDALAQASWTRPATASLLTGVDPPVHGATSIRQGLRPEIPTLAEQLAAAGYATAAFVTNVNVAGRWGFSRGFDRYEYLPEDENSDTVHVRSDVLSARAADWLAALEPARPFLLYVHATDPHAPYHPPDDLARIWAPGGRCWPDAQTVLQRVKRDPDRTTPDDLRLLHACYDAEITFNDRSLGALVDTLARQQRLEDTLIVVTADHGEEFFEHHGFEHGRTLFDEQLRVPLVMRFPDDALRGRRVAARARQIDVAPTVLEYLDLPIPAEIRGRSLLADALRQVTPLPVESYAHTRLGGRDLQAITTGRWKVIEGERGRGIPLQAFDLDSDPLERHSRSRERPMLAEYAREALAVWLADLPRSTDPARGPNPPAEADAETLERLRALGYVE